MRIVTLSLLFVTAFYFFGPQPKKKAQIDFLKFKASAPERIERFLTRPKAEVIKVEEIQSASELPETPASEDPNEDLEVSETEDQLEHTEEIPVNELEEGWSEELRNVLINAEPEYGKEMFKSYSSERESYHSELDTLVRENQRSPDLETMISDLETRHEERLKEIFGPHYEEIKDRHGKYLENSSFTTN